MSKYYQLVTSEGVVEGHSVIQVSAKYAAYRIAKFVTENREYIKNVVLELLLVVLGVMIFVFIPDEGTVGFVCVGVGSFLIFDQTRAWVKRKKK